MNSAPPRGGCATAHAVPMRRAHSGRTRPRHRSGCHARDRVGGELPRLVCTGPRPRPPGRVFAPPRARNATAEGGGSAPASALAFAFLSSVSASGMRSARSRAAPYRTSRSGWPGSMSSAVLAHFKVWTRTASSSIGASTIAWAAQRARSGFCVWPQCSSKCRRASSKGERSLRARWRRARANAGSSSPGISSRAVA